MAHDIADFDFALPPDRIAQHPARPRDAARLLHVARDGLADRLVRDLPDLLRPGDVLVANDTRVIPAQLTARRAHAGGEPSARIGITLDRPRADGTWHALARNARRLRAGDVLRFDGSGDLTATVAERDPDGGVALAFDRAGEAFAAALREAGALALPPYIARPHGPRPEDAAGLPDRVRRARGRRRRAHRRPAFHPGLAGGAGRARRPPRHPDAACRRRHLPAGARRRHRAPPHPRRTRRVFSAAAATINAAREAGGRVVAVGTTCVRLLESAADDAGRIHPFAGDTELFILPGYRFRAVDLMVTNFHLPRSTLFMLVCAFAGTARMRAAYAHAIARRLPLLLLRRRVFA